MSEKSLTTSDMKPDHIIGEEEKQIISSEKKYSSILQAMKVTEDKLRETLIMWQKATKKEIDTNLKADQEMG